MSSVRKILFVSLSNIGDAILGLPVIDRLRVDYPQAAITVVSAPRPQELFTGNPAVAEVIVYDKHCRLGEKLALLRRLRREKFDKVVDLRNGMFGLFVPAASGPSFPRKAPRSVVHSVRRHLYALGPAAAGRRPAGAPGLFIGPADRRYCDDLLAGIRASSGQPLVVCSVGARSDIKRWPQEHWSGLIELLVSRLHARVVLAGDQDDIPVCAAVRAGLSPAAAKEVVDLCGRTSLAQLGCLLEKAAALVTNDSANMHLASYLDVPVAAVFGPTDERVYGPWSKFSRVVCRQIACRPCRKARCRYGRLDCLRLVKPDDVFEAVAALLDKDRAKPPEPDCPGYRRILVIRSDKLGDVVLSTPALESLRRAFPNALISLMVRPYTLELITGNRFIDDILVYDKKFLDRTPLRTLALAWRIRRQRFDCALILNPSIRNHLLAFLAGIPRRIGYDSKAGFLLTGRLANTKHLGEKHEVEYNLDLLRSDGIPTVPASLHLPLSRQQLEYAEECLGKHGISAGEPFCIINPGTNDPSRIWDPRRYAEVADRLIADRGLKVMIFSGPADAEVARQVLGAMRQKGIDMVNNTTISEQAAVISRCSLFISPDTGPMHIASALNVPVIALFGRKDSGLSPKRWGPLSLRHWVIQKDVGCTSCLAHKCRKGFLCLQAITVEEVLAAAGRILLDK